MSSHDGTVVLTGATSGIGEAMALRLADSATTLVGARLAPFAARHRVLP
jgi:NADP-dependent 3-hydroxy acid dehydrogenase YdfG